MYEMLKVKDEIIVDGFYTIYYFEHGKNYTHTPERHDFWEVVYVDEGEIIAVSDGAGINLKQGMIIFHEPNEIHAHISNQKVVNNMVVITFASDSPAMDFFRGKIFMLDKPAKTLLSLFMEEAQNSLGERPLIYSHTQKIDESQVPFGGTQLLKCYLTEFLIGLIRRGDALENKNVTNDSSRLIATNSIMEMIIESLKNRIYSSLTLEELCDEFMIGKSRLTSEFKAHTGKSPMEYYRYLKIKEAKRLLRGGDHSISEISDMLGYSSIHIFSRAFKKEARFSPREYQRGIVE